MARSFLVNITSIAPDPTKEFERKKVNYHMRQVKIVTESIKDQIYDILKEEIFSGELKSGEQLVEQAIADRFSTSRSPVREAIKQLTGDGLVVNITNRGTFVKRPTMQDIQDIQEMRLMIESFAVHKIVNTLTESDKEELLHLRDQIVESKENEDRETFLALEKQVWVAIVMMTKNSYIIDNYCKLYAIISNFKKSIIIHTPDTFSHSVEERLAIIDALLAGNADEAVRLTKAHLLHSTEILCSAVDVQNEQDDSSPKHA